MTTGRRKRGFSFLQKNVISKGLCTACGTCVGICPPGILERGGQAEEAEPFLTRPPCPDCGLCIDVCPGKDIPLLRMEKMVFGRTREPGQDELGVYLKCFATHAADPRIRRAGASGGSTTAVLAYALDKGIIDGAIVAGFNETVPYRTEGKIVRNSGDLVAYAKSKHAGTPPVNAVLSRAIQEARISRLGTVGCPCHIHGLRKIQMSGKPARIANSIKLVLGLFCGTQMYFEGTRHLLVEVCGLDSLDEIAAIDYRWGEWPGKFYVRTKAGKEILVDRHDYVYHFLQPAWQKYRCEMCVDHCAELADIAFGDYWRPNSKAGEPGWNLTIARSETGLQILEQAEKDGYLVMKEGDIDKRSFSGIELAKHRSPFVLELRKRYGIPVPDYEIVVGHEPKRRAEIAFAPTFNQLASGGERKG